MPVGASYSSTYAALLATYGVVTGLGMSALYVAAYATVPLWFDRRRGAATGLASAGLGAGLLVVAPTATRTSGRTRPSSFRRGDRTPSRATGAPASRRSAAGCARSRSGWSCWGGCSSTRRCTSWSTTSSPSPRARGCGGRAWRRYVGVATSAARLTVGPASDRIGRVRIFVACSAVMGAGLLALPFAREPVALFAVTVCFGIGYGGNGALLSPLVADLFGTDQLGTLGLVGAACIGAAGRLRGEL